MDGKRKNKKTPLDFRRKPPFALFALGAGKIKVSPAPKTVLFGGSFDLFHYGHLLAIKKAKKLGDYLVINVNTDKRAREKKGEGRPIIPLRERIAIVANLKDVDRVVSSDLKGNIGNLLDFVKPDILAVNDEKHFLNEEEECKKRNIKMVVLKRQIPPSGLDTTKIINKIKNL